MMLFLHRRGYFYVGVAGVWLGYGRLSPVLLGFNFYGGGNDFDILKAVPDLD
jgi:hypothetical protein